MHHKQNNDMQVLRTHISETEELPSRTDLENLKRMHNADLQDMVQAPMTKLNKKLKKFENGYVIPDRPPKWSCSTSSVESATMMSGTIHFFFENRHMSCFQRRNEWYTVASPHFVGAPRRG